jgi:hypothetical protein
MGVLFMLLVFLSTTTFKTIEHDKGCDGKGAWRQSQPVQIGRWCVVIAQPFSGGRKRITGSEGRQLLKG